MAEPTVMSIGPPTGTDRLAGVTLIGGGVGVGAAFGVAVGSVVGADEGGADEGEAGEGGAVGEGLGSGAAAYRAAQAAMSATLRNLRFGAMNRRGQQCFVTDAREEHGYEIPLRAFDGTRTEFGMPDDVGDLEAAGRGPFVDAAAEGSQTVVASAAVDLIEIFPEVVEDEAAPAGYRLGVLQHHCELALIVGLLGFVVRQVQYQFAMLADGFGQTVGRLPDVLDISRLLEQRDDDFEFRERQLEDLAKIDHRNAARLIAEHFDRSEDALNLFDVGIFSGQKIVLDARVAHPVDQDAARRQPVAPGAAGLLGVGFQRARQIVMDDETNVRLVDAEAEGVGRDDGANRFVHEKIVDGGAVFFVKLRMIDGGWNAKLDAEIALYLQCVLDRRRVNDAGAL